MKEKLQEYALIAEIVGAVAIVISLLFVGYELRRNTEAFYAQTRQAVLESSQEELFEWVRNLDIHNSVIKQGMLTPEEQIKINFFLLALLRVREYSWLQYQDGIIDKRQWDTEAGVIGIVLSSVRTRKWWNKIGRDNFNPEFSAFIDNYLQDIPVSDEFWKAQNSWDN